jgi:hypothetical protein
MNQNGSHIGLVVLEVPAVCSFWTPAFSMGFSLLFLSTTSGHPEKMSTGHSRTTRWF